MSYIYLVNKENPLGKKYEPQDLVEPAIPFDAKPGDPKRLMRYEAALAAEYLFGRATEHKIALCGISGYRSYKRQAYLYKLSVNGLVAAPGTSEHQSGLALDVSTPEIGLELEESFADTRAGKWVHAYAPLYGFILRYPKGKEDITGFPYEPWHLRYVTKSLALYLTLTGLTLEEYHRIG